jgi:hypothetical protein
MDAYTDHQADLINEIEEITEELVASRGDYSRKGIWVRRLLCVSLSRRLDALQGSSAPSEH